MWLDWLVFCNYGFSVSALWCPLATSTILLGFLLPWTWGISSRLLQQSAAAAPYLEWGHPSWPWTWSSSSRLSCRCSCHSLDLGLLLLAATPNLRHGAAHLGCSSWPRAWGSSSRLRPLTSDVRLKTLLLSRWAPFLNKGVSLVLLLCHVSPWTIHFQKIA